MLYSLWKDEWVLIELGNPQKYAAKLYRQITLKILSLQVNPRPQDSKPIGDGYRVDRGEYRIYYEISDDKGLATIYWVGKRGVDEFYKGLRQEGFL